MLSNKLYRHDMEIWSYEDHWGELASRQKRSLSSDIVNSVILGSERAEKPKEYVFSLEEEGDDEIQLPRDICPVNEVVRHTIRLNFYSKKLQQCIRSLALRKGEYRGPPLGKLPEMGDRRKERLYWFGAVQACVLPPLDRNLIRRMVEKAALTILAQTGYDRVRRVALDTLVDVVLEYLNKVCHLSHTFAQHDLNRGQVAYDDVLEKALRTVGLDGIHAVKDYYKRRVLLKRERAHTRAKRLLTIYDKLLTKYGHSPSTLEPPASEHEQQREQEPGQSGTQVPSGTPDGIDP